MASATATVLKFQPQSVVGAQPTPEADQLRLHIANQLSEMTRFRTHIGIVDRLNNCLRLREGQYDAQQAQAIAEFGGSSVFARLGTNKIRGAASMLRSIFIQGDRPWEIKPTPVPTLPDDIMQSIEQLITQEVQTLQAAGQQVNPTQVQQRIQQLRQAAMEAARKQARLDATEASRFVDDLLTEGNFYSELNAFILDFSTYPYAVMAGPTAVMQTGVKYVNKKPLRVRAAKLTYRRVDPYYIMWSPGAASLQDADIIERMPMSRTALNNLIGLEGYDENAIRSAIRDYGDSGYSYREFFEPVHEDALNQSSIFYNTQIDVIAYTGRLIGRDLKEMGFDETDTDEELDDDLDYQVQAWVCGDYVLKRQIDPDPSNRPAYYSAAYEPVPGSIPGTALPELIQDVIEVYNATLRSLVNNIALASGPMVGVNTSRWQPPAGGRVQLVPWMIWRYESDPTAPSGEKPVEFFQPNLNAQELMNTLLFLQNLADEISGIPRYLTGSDRVGGAGRTSSGLSMLMSNANRTMTSVAGGIDEQILEPLLKKTYDLVLLTTGTDVLRGDEEIAPRGATYAEQREQDRMRMIEFLNSTMNPVDMQIMGVNGRGAILRKVSESFMGDEEVVPSEQALMQMQEQQKQAAMMQQQAAAAGEVTDNQSSGGAQQPPGKSAPGGSPAKPAHQRASSQFLARGTDNHSRVRSGKAIAKQSKAA